MRSGNAEVGAAAGSNRFAVDQLRGRKAQLRAAWGRGCAIGRNPTIRFRVYEKS